LVLVILLVLVTCINLYTGLHRVETKDSAILCWMADSPETPDTPNKAAAMFSDLTPEASTDILFDTAIDPNSASYDALIRSGFGFRTARNLIRYRQAGGRIRNAGDLKKIYGMDSAQFARVEHRVFFVTPEAGNKEVKAPHILELNRADSASLEELPGIGPVLARRILRYRDLVGGFYDPLQLSEVFGIEDSLVQSLTKRLSADTALLVRISLNKTTEKELAKHPYVGRYKAAAIVRFRAMEGSIKKADDLVTQGVLETKDYRKLRPYLAN
jgi:DNA uptake protein ComE-like DNA-binding protein